MSEFQQYKTFSGLCCQALNCTISFRLPLIIELRRLPKKSWSIGKLTSTNLSFSCWTRKHLHINSRENSKTNCKGLWMLCLVNSAQSDTFVTNGHLHLAFWQRRWWSYINQRNRVKSNYILTEACTVLAWFVHSWRLVSKICCMLFLATNWLYMSPSVVSLAFQISTELKWVVRGVDVQEDCNNSWWEPPPFLWFYCGTPWQKIWNYSQGNGCWGSRVHLWWSNPLTFSWHI